MDKNYEERKRLFEDARKIKIGENTMKSGVKLITKKLQERGGKDAYIETTSPTGKKCFVGWIARWGNKNDGYWYDVTFMGYTFIGTDNFEDACRGLIQLGLAQHINEYKFVYGV